MEFRTIAVLAGCVTVVSVAAILSQAGPLNPPAGAVAPSYKTLTEVEPRTVVSSATTPGDSDSVFRISQPGSYYLAGNVTGASGKSGIEIGSHDVTLDLNGFEVVGVAGSVTGVRAVGGTTSLGNVTVSNGTIRFWGTSGIDINAAPRSRVLKVNVSSNSAYGIVLGDSSTAANCTVSGSVLSGIIAGNFAMIESCRSTDNGTGATLGIGIGVQQHSVVRGCVATNNGTGAGGGYGISCDTTTLISGCEASGNGSGAAGGAGISTSDTCTIESCLASNNGVATATLRYGILVHSGCTVRNCVVNLNAGDGIRFLGQCLIDGNMCISNGLSGGDGANIHATGNRSRIENNLCDGADRGIDIDVSGNTIVRNVCSNNTTNYDIVAGNDVGPIGTAAAGTSPWANIQH